MKINFFLFVFYLYLLQPYSSLKINKIPNLLQIISKDKSILYKVLGEMDLVEKLKASLLKDVYDSEIEKIKTELYNFFEIDKSNRLDKSLRIKKSEIYNLIDTFLNVYSTKYSIAIFYLTKILTFLSIILFCLGILSIVNLAEFIKLIIQSQIFKDILQIILKFMKEEKVTFLYLISAFFIFLSLFANENINSFICLPGILILWVNLFFIHFPSDNLFESFYFREFLIFVISIILGVKLDSKLIGNFFIFTNFTHIPSLKSFLSEIINKVYYNYYYQGSPDIKTDEINNYKSILFLILYLIFKLNYFKLKEFYLFEFGFAINGIIMLFVYLLISIVNSHSYYILNSRTKENYQIGCLIVFQIFFIPLFYMSLYVFEDSYIEISLMIFYFLYTAYIILLCEDNFLIALNTFTFLLLIMIKFKLYLYFALALNKNN